MESTYLARLTPPGTAALATLALCGPEAWTMVRGLVQPALPAEPEPGRFWLRCLGDDLGRDEVVLSLAQSASEGTSLACASGWYADRRNPLSWRPTGVAMASGHLHKPGCGGLFLAEASAPCRSSRLANDGSGSSDASLHRPDGGHSARPVSRCLPKSPGRDPGPS